MTLIKKILVLLILIQLSSCYKLEYLEQPPLEIEWNPELALPIIEKEISIDTWVEGIPLQFLNLFSVIELQDTIQLNLQDLRTNELDINKVTFHILMENRFGADVGGQAYFVTGNYTVIDSLFKSGPINLQAASVSINDGQIVETFPKIEDSEYDAETFNIITEESRYMIINYKLDISSLEPELLNFLPNQSIKINLGAKIDFTKTFE